MNIGFFYNEVIGIHLCMHLWYDFTVNSNICFKYMGRQPST